MHGRNGNNNKYFVLLVKKKSLSVIVHWRNLPKMFTKRQNIFNLGRTVKRVWTIFLKRESILFTFFYLSSRIDWLTECWMVSLMLCCFQPIHYWRGTWSPHDHQNVFSKSTLFNPSHTHTILDILVKNWKIPILST